MVSGQLNLTPDVITFRNSSARNKTTTHYGMLDLYGISGGGFSSVYVRNETTGTHSFGPYGLYAFSTTSTSGCGGRFDGSRRGVMGIATVFGSGHRYGGWFNAGNTTSGNSYGVYATAYGSNGKRYGGYFDVGSASNDTSFGIYARTTGGNGIQFAGYFVGDVYSTGSYLPSDVMLKTDVEPLQGSLSRVLSLKPKSYRYNTAEYADMNLPASRYAGLLAQDLEGIYPQLVKIAVAPAPACEDSASSTGAAVDRSFKAVNYVGLIPELIAAIQEQQAQITEQKARIEELALQVNELKKK